MLVLAVALAAGLYAAHVFVPPTPGPLAAAAVLEADLGMVMILGLAVAIPVSLAGYLWAKYLQKRHKYQEDVEIESSETVISKLPKTSWSLYPIVIPIVLIALKSVANYPTFPFGEGTFSQVINFIGNPIVALLIGVFLAFALKPKSNEAKHIDWISSGLKEAGVIILITGAGGAFGAILRESGVGDIIGESFANMELGLLLPFIIAAVLKSAQGSSTVSIITTAAIMAPILASFGLESSLGRVLTVLAIGSGAMTVSHLNDSFFWVVAQFSGLDTATALRSQTIATLIQGVTGILLVLFMGWIFI
jgi:GntP family gluconate:H+ symporter